LFLRTIFAVTLLAAPAWAQQAQSPTPDTKPPENQSAQPAQSTGTGTSQEKKTPDDAQSNNGQDQNSKTNANGTSNDRLFYTLPNFLTLENAGNVPPLTTGQKFKVEVRSSFDPIQIAWYGFLSAISQAENSEPGYGQGWAGYGKRYGAAAADGTIENFMVAAVIPSIFKQDPRFYQSGKGGFLHRTGYALSRMVVTRGDNGNAQFNVSEVLGSALAAGISTYSYHPHADKTLVNTTKVWGTQLGWDSLTYVIKEFWPDIRRKVHKERSGSHSPGPATSSELAIVPAS
jgi:hypothetical protein